MKSLPHPFAIVCAFTFGVCNAWSAGVAVLKEQTFHRDSSACAIVYSQIIDSNGPFLRLVSNGVNIDIDRSKLAARIELADEIPEFIMEESDISPSRDVLAAIREFATRYPRSAPLLASRDAALATHIRHFDDGEVRFEGTWISKNKLTGIVETRRRESADVELAEVEKRIFEAAQRDKGLVLHDGKWMTKWQEAQRSPEWPTQLSECIEPLWNGNTEGAGFAVKNLGILASHQTGATKVRTERLMITIRNLFLAESRLTRQTIFHTTEAYKAAIHDKNAAKWLEPNAFGTINHDASRDSRAKATEIRQRSADEHATCKQELLDQLREIEIVAADFIKLRESRVVLILGRAERVMAARHFTPTEFSPSSPDESHTTIGRGIVRGSD